MVIPYLHYQGDCEEAFALYAEAFGGSIEHLSRHTPESGSPATLAGKVMHAHVSLGEHGALNGSDGETPPDIGNAITFIVHCDARAQAQSIADKLATGGILAADFTPNPPPDDDSCCAVVKDKFGYTWFIACPTT